MEVRIHQRQGETQDQELIKQAAEFILSDLLKESILSNLTVEISLCNSFPYSLSGDIVTYGSRHFRVRLNRQHNFIDLLQTLAHELVHVKQYATGELSLTRSEASWKWKGQLFRTELDDEEYNDTPWEKEAFSEERRLAKRFIDTLI